MATLAEWVEGARPRTLPAAIAPVLVGTASAYALGRWHGGQALLAALVALALQIGVNYANDYSDGIRGTDEVRVGPVRLVGQGLAVPGAVKRAAFACFGLAGLGGLALVAWTGTWWLLLAGVAGVIAAWFYTGGSHPYGYLGLGEVFVFVFFGLMAVLGTTWTQARDLGLGTWTGAIGIGLIACAVLMANNIRDIAGDRVSGKRTLAVRLGTGAAQVAYAAMLGGALLCGAVAALGGYPWAWLAWACVPLAALLVQRLRRATTPRQQIAVLAGTGRLELLYAVLFSLGLVLSRTD